MDLSDSFSFLDGSDKTNIAREAARKASIKRIPELEKEWRDEVRPAIEDSFDEDKEYIFHPDRLSYETGLPSDYIERCMKYYQREFEQEEFVLEERSNGYWSLHRF